MENPIDQETLKEVKILMENDPSAAAAKIKEYVEMQSNIPLNIAITGETGSGKSTFVNAFRGMNDNSEGAAPTGCVETTAKPKPYRHPVYPNVILWDFPGVGTTRFPADKYLKDVGLENFDFFIIISDTCFRETDVKLAKETQRMGKRFYFVHSKIDQDLRSEKKKKNFSKEETIRKLRKNCTEGLQKEGFESPQVFLVSSFERRQFDFPLLHGILDRELPEHKRRALLMAMPNISLEVINKKKAAFQTQIKYYAALSALGAAVPVPGLSAAVDLGLIVAAVTQYKAGFCLDAQSVEKLAASTGVSVDDLRSSIQSLIAEEKITKDLILKLLSQVAGTIALLAAEEGCRLIPIIGIPVAMGLSFTTTYRLLGYFLNLLAEAAQMVFRRSLGLNPV